MTAKAFSSRISPPFSRTGMGMLIVAHRGNRRHAPENSLAGFRQAIGEGADLLETDLRMTADGNFICFHDATLERTTDRSGAVERLTLEEVRQATLRAGGSEWKREKIPTLDELAAILPTDVALALELKSSRFRDPATCRVLVQAIERLGVRDKVIVLAFSAQKLRNLQQEGRGIPAGHVRLVPWPGDQFELVGPLGVLLRINPSFVRKAHERGLLVCPLDTNPDRSIAYYRRLGVDALITDDPAATIAAVRRS